MRKLTLSVLLAIFMLGAMACGRKAATGNATDSIEKKDAAPRWPWKAGDVVAQADIDAVGLDGCFVIDTISDALLQRMKAGKTWKDNTPASLRSQLRYLRMLHRNLNGEPQMGEMVVHKRIAERTLRIFRQLYDAGYRIERMLLMDEFGADDEKAMRANNTSAFNFRFKSNSTTDISNHGYGLAIDLNTLYNPYVKVVRPKMPARYDYRHRLKGYTYDFEPATGEPYAFERDTRTDIPMKIDSNDLACKLFKAEGFDWGGDWRSRKDYQHFEYNSKR